MDGTRFDHLARGLAHAETRRRFVAGFVASLLGLFATREVEAAQCREIGTVCREHSNCCSGICGTGDRRGRRSCQCGDESDCPAPGICRTVTCAENGCVTSVVEPGTACTMSNGEEGVCEGASCLQACGLDRDPCGDDSDCCAGFVCRSFNGNLVCLERIS